MTLIKCPQCNQTFELICNKQNCSVRCPHCGYEGIYRGKDLNVTM